MPVDLRWAWAVLLGLMLSIPLMVTKADPDLWGHTRFGVDIIQTKTLPAVDPYSFTQDRPWVNHEWLSEVAMGAAYARGGSAGLVVLKVLVVGLAFILIAGGLRAVHPLATGGLLALAVAASPSITGTVRPQIWTFLALVVLVRLLQTGRYLWCPLLFAAWVNFHGGWIVGMGVLGVWCAVTALERWREGRRPSWTLIALPALSFVATIANPYGWGMWHFIASTVGFTRDISEWQPIYTSAGAGTIAIGLVATLVAALQFKRDTRASLPWLAVLAILASGSVRVSRVAPLAAPLGILIAGPSLAHWWPRSAWAFKAPSSGAAALTALPLILIALAVGRVVAPAFACIPLEGAWIPDTLSGQAIARSAATGRLVTLFGWGQYAIWHFAPRLRVSLDGRRETVYSDEVSRIHGAIYRGEPAGDAWLEQVRPEYLWLSPSENARRRQWLEAHGYRIDIETDRGYVAARADLPLLESATTGPVTCFP